MSHQVNFSSMHRKEFVRWIKLFFVLVLFVTSGVTPVKAAVNAAPTLDDINDMTVAEDSSTTTIQLTGISAGAGDEGQTLTISALSSNPSILPNPAIDYTSPEAGGSLSFTPAQNRFGDVDVTVTVQDNGGVDDGGIDTVTNVFRITITGVNDPPTITSFQKTGKRGFSLAFSAQDFLSVYSDIENNPLSYIQIVSLPVIGKLAIDGEPIGVNTEIPANQLDKLSFVANKSWYGETSFTFNASDGQDYASSPVEVNLDYPYSLLFTYFPSISKPIQPPSSFSKIAPGNGSVGQPLSLSLDWQDASSEITFYYQYCYDAFINNTCDGGWINTGTVSQALLSGLNYSTTYEWHVRAVNTAGTTYSNGSGTAYHHFSTLSLPAWVTSFSENFEGSFPGAWQLSSSIFDWDYLEYVDVTSLLSWGKRSCHAATGSYGGWAVGGGSYGQTVSCSDSYPDDYEALMVYGPINLSQAKDALLSIKIWSDIELNYDELGWGVSLDNDTFYGSAVSGDSGGWISRTLDLKNVYTLGNVTGKPQVWIGVWFVTDSMDISYEQGVAVDDLVLSTCSSASGCAGSPSLSEASQLPEGFQIGPASKLLNPPATRRDIQLLNDRSPSWINKANSR